MENNELQQKRDACVKEVNEVLAKYNMRLYPTLQIAPVSVPTEDVVTTEEDEQGGDQ